MDGGKDPACIAELNQLVCFEPSCNTGPVVRSVEGDGCSASFLFNQSDDDCVPCRPAASVRPEVGDGTLFKRLFRRS